MNDIPLPTAREPSAFLREFRYFVRGKGLAYKTELTFVQWVNRFVRFHNKQHPREMGAAEVEGFL